PCHLPSSTTLPYTTLFRSKSKPSASRLLAGTPPSGMTGDIREVGEIDAQRMHGRGQALLGRHLENDGGVGRDGQPGILRELPFEDRKSTRLNSSHVKISYA